MVEDRRLFSLATALSLAALVGPVTPATAAERPRLPQPIVLTLEVERVRPPKLPEPLVLRLEIEREEAPSESQETTAQDEITWEPGGEVSTRDYQACLAKSVEFTRKCDEIAHRWATEDCRRSKHRSGCLNWKVGCFSPFTPGWVFSEANCSRPGFFQCASATYPGYIGCVDGCNTAKDRGVCLHKRCQAQAKISLGRCGDGKTTENAWREPSGGPPDAQPGSDPNVAGALGAKAADDATELGTPSGMGSTIKKGRAAVRRDGQRKMLSPGESPRSGEQIVAIEPCSLSLPDGTVVSLGPSAKMTYDADKHEALVQTGKALFDHAADVAAHEAWKAAKAGIGRQWELLKVVTSGVRTALLGTSFLVETDPEARTDRVLVQEGELEVQGMVSGRARVSAGRQVTARDGVLGQAEPLPAAAWAAERRELEAERADTTQAAAPGAAAGARGREVAGGCSGIAGRWRWFNGVMVECFGEGRCEASNGFGGPWKCLDPSGRFEIQWGRPGQLTPYVDTVSLSADGWELRGANQSGQGVGGQRPEFAGGDPQGACQAILGKWRWSGGALIECGPDNTCTSNSGMHGPWRCVNERGRFEIRWGRDGRPDQFIDSVTVSPLGSYLTGKNQHGGGVGAIRE